MPPGRWVYSVTPVFATSWRGVESLKSNTVAILGPLDHLVLAPAASAIHPGGSQTYAAQGFDAYGSALGDVTSATTFTVDGAACAGATCAPAAAGNHTVTGADTTATGTATLHVNAVLAAYGWGWNSSGQVGDGTQTQRSSPVQVGAGTYWASATAGGSHTIALRSAA